VYLHAASGMGMSHRRGRRIATAANSGVMEQPGPSELCEGGDALTIVMIFIIIFWASPCGSCYPWLRVRYGLSD